MQTKICSLCKPIPIFFVLMLFIKVSTLSADNLSILELQSLRAAGLPRTISPSDRSYALISNLWQGQADGVAAASELINWIFVEEPTPQTTEKFDSISLHPAARSLIALGDVSLPLLSARLQGDISQEDGELIVSCMKRIWREQAPTKLRELEGQAASGNVKAAVEAVLHGKERSKRFDDPSYNF